MGGRDEKAKRKFDQKMADWHASHGRFSVEGAPDAAPGAPTVHPYARIMKPAQAQAYAETGVIDHMRNVKGGKVEVYFKRGKMPDELK